MAPFRVGIIGCGRPHSSAGATGYGMSHQHARGYEASPDAEIVALADIDLDNARAFQREHGGRQVYADYRQMLARERLDIVSISTWPHLHAEMVVAAARAGVRAVHCEKPMAPTFGEAQEMVRVCRELGVQLSFNHQRRFGGPFRKARELVRAGAIGQLLRLEASCSNLYDWGTHWFDMMSFYNEDQPVAWVMGQLEARGSQRIFGVPVEGQGMSQFRYVNGVFGLLLTGPANPYGASNRLVGSEGVIEVDVIQPRLPLRYWAQGQAVWQVPAVAGDAHGPGYVELAIQDVVAALKEGREPELAARKALQATELIFATYESSRRRARVDLPLTIDDSPLLTMLADGQLVSTGLD